MSSDLIAEGLSLEEAQRQARVAFGNVTVLEERSREVWQWPTLKSIVAEVRFALRQLRKSPGFCVTAVLTLAMAIGANALVFGVLNGMILRPLDVPDPQSLYSIDRTSGSDMSQSYPDYLDLRERNQSFADLAAYTIPQATLDTGHDPVVTWGLEASGNYFDVLLIHPWFGRFFHASDEHGPNSAPFSGALKLFANVATILTDAFWFSAVR